MTSKNDKLRTIGVSTDATTAALTAPHITATAKKFYHQVIEQLEIKCNIVTNKYEKLFLLVFK